MQGYDKALWFQQDTEGEDHQVQEATLPTALDENLVSNFLVKFLSEEQNSYLML